MHIILLLTAIGLLCGGHWVEYEWVYNLHPAAAGALGILTYLVMPNAEQRSHDHKRYEMIIVVAREHEYRVKAILVHLGLEDPEDDEPVED